MALPSAEANDTVTALVGVADNVTMNVIVVVEPALPSLTAAGLSIDNVGAVVNGPKCTLSKMPKPAAMRTVLIGTVLSNP